MSAENSLWGAPRIHGELLKLGFEVGQSSVAKYMVKRYGPVCTENSVLIDYVTESPNVGDDDRSVLPFPGPVRLAVQVEEPT
jgi:hypothetical protein